MPQDDYRKNWSAARRAIGYDTPIALRDLRHTWGTLAGRMVGADAARDGLAHTNISTTNRYLSGDVARVAAASVAIQVALQESGTVGGTPGSPGCVDAPQVLGMMERATGIEPATLGLGSRCSAS